ncbi:hypothetical protein [Micromonospora cremea]|uniref:Uncharacterized protein n=1 Tax=Micromonospora cremea TaxID=709881 RepID=A0A1N5U288_9ACTN|nr:hypothetical protein [Micromonospora cremea]SIM54863.1 hypothetical protein SAMN04489832_0557 [Micromonospora cremea]
MDAIVAFFADLGTTLLIAAGLWIVAHAFLTLVTLGNVGLLRMLLRLRKVIAAAPSGASFHCRDGQVSMIYYDRARDEDRSVDLWRFPRPSLLRWSGRPRRSLTAVRRRMNTEIAWRAALLCLVAVPLVVGTSWLAVTVQWTWIYLTVLLLGHHAFTAYSQKFFIVKPGTMFLATGLLLIDRTNWWNFSTVTLTTIYFVWGLLTFVVLTWLVRGERAEAASRRSAVGTPAPAR